MTGQPASQRSVAGFDIIDRARHNDSTGLIDARTHRTAAS